MGESESPTSSIGCVVLFNGPPSSGKSSLVRALRPKLPTPWFHLSLDDFRAGISERFWLEDDGTLFDRVLSGYLGSLCQIVSAGINVLAEAVITPSRQVLYQRVFGETPLIVVGVTCPFEVAVQRETTRTDRRRGPIELMADDYAAVHAGLSYDYVVASDEGSPDELANGLAHHFERLPASSFESHLL